MVKMRLVITLLWLLQVATAVRADDIDAYFPAGAPGNVYVHVVMDLGDSNVDIPLCTYGVNCGPPFMTDEANRHLGDMYLDGETVTAPGVFKAVLSAVAQDPRLNGFYISLSIFNHAQNQSGPLGRQRGGGTILQGYRQLPEHSAEFVATVKSIPVLASENAHSLQPRESYFEWSRYLRGGEVALGDNTSGNFGRSDPLPNYDTSIIAQGDYLSEFTDRAGCPGLYSILFTLGLPASDEDLNAEMAAQMPLSGQTSFEQMLTYLHERGTDLLPQVDAIAYLQKTWVVTSHQRPGNAAAYAAAGGGGKVLYVDDPVGLQANLTAALVGVRAIGSSTTGAVFSQDVFNAGRALDELYLPLFLPQWNMSWPGNLKKLKLGNSAASGDSGNDMNEGSFDRIVDVHGDPAFEPFGDTAGQLRFDALTFWTDAPTLPPGDGKILPENADGPIVARGGAGQKIDGFVGYSTGEGEVVQHFIGDTNSDSPVNGYMPRQLYYEPVVGLSLQPFDADKSTLSALAPLLDPTGELTDEARLNLIRWARGQDTGNGKPGPRDWIMGEVLHSLPIALNYGATPGYSRSNPNIRLLFGSGEGIFHILENTNRAGNESGREVFGFFPSETLGSIRLHHDNTTSAKQKRYGVDGAPVVLKVDSNGDGTLDYNDGDKAFVYFGLRRGGSSYFALDISNPAAVPSLLWKISPTVGGQFDELGLTFSTPVVGKVNFDGVPVDVLVFAGGYDGGWNEGHTARRGKDFGADDDSAGNAIYIVNAHTGELIWKAIRGTTGVSSNKHYEHAGLVDSIPSTVAVLVTPGGIIHRLYVGDSGGAVWRVDLPLNTVGNDNHRRDYWFITKLGDLGFDMAESGGSESDDRRFFPPPDIVSSFDEIGDFDGVLIASGNRANPNETAVANYLFYMKDRETSTGSAQVRARNDRDDPPGRYHFADLPDQTTCLVGSEQVVSGQDSMDCADRSFDSGWKVRFEQPGEKGLSTPLTDGGRIFTSTFVPGKANDCSAQPGHGRLYVLQLADGTASANQLRYYDIGPGIPAAAASVGDDIFLPGSGIALYDQDGDGVREKVKILPSLAGKLYRIYWREPGTDPL